MNRYRDERHPDLELALQRIEPLRLERMSPEVSGPMPPGVIGDLGDVVANLDKVVYPAVRHPIFCTYDPVDCSEAA
ncbi:MAG: hypothetical protein ACP5JG_19160 [Anaerolineae bacterium]